ncbi:uncharacterized protein [Apostichopus japonicus]|uniref:uncharacterized protein n=1 Tax=Stichopus japonicus TaxID=307972 RepID=UPI003AB52717
MSSRALKDLQKQLDGLAAELARAKVGKPDAQPNTVYVLPSERKLLTFTGTDGLPVMTFVADIRTALKLRRLQGTDATEFVMTYLAGAARQEIRHQPDKVSSDADAILRTLCETFGERRSQGSVMREICSSVQKDGETVSEFAFRLMALADEFAKIPGAPKPETAIKEQFLDGLLDGVLRREWKRLMKEDKGKTFIKLRDWALDLAEEESDFVPRRTRRAAVNSTEAATHQLSAVSQLERLEREGQRYKGRGRPRPDRKDIECRRCHQMGHYASECQSPTPINVPSGN